MAIVSIASKPALKAYVIFLANFVDQNTTVGNLDIYQVMHAAGQIETLLGIGVKTNFKNAG